MSSSSGQQQIRILTIDDHPIFREGLCAIIASQPDMTVVGEAATAEEGIVRHRDLRPDITLMDLRLPGLHGTTALSEIRREFPDARTIVLTTAEQDGEIQRAIRAGAAAYLLKSAPASELLGTIRDVHRGQRRRVTPDVAARLAEYMGDGDLTAREVAVLKLVQEGNRNKEIAASLGIAEATVNFHIRNIVEKLHANDRAHALAIALRRGLIEI